MRGEFEDYNLNVWKYTASQLDRALKGTFGEERASVAKTAGMPPLTRFYSTPDALVLGCVTDIEGDRNGIPTISEALKASEIRQELLRVKEMSLKGETSRPIIIPVTEQRKILGFKRDHWVTLHYDPQTNTATIIDSKPGYRAWLYPTAPMIDMLKQGLADVMGTDAVEGMNVKHVHLGVQNDDYSCGPRTRDIISRLTTGTTLDNLRRIKHPSTSQVVSECEAVGGLKTKKPEGFWTRIFNKIKNVLTFSPKESAKDPELVSIDESMSFSSESSQDSSEVISTSHAVMNSLLGEAPRTAFNEDTPEEEAVAKHNPYEHKRGGITSGARYEAYKGVEELEDGEEEAEELENEREEEQFWRDISRPM